MIHHPESKHQCELVVVTGTKEPFPSVNNLQVHVPTTPKRKLEPIMPDFGEFLYEERFLVVQFIIGFELLTVLRGNSRQLLFDSFLHPLLHNNG
jgi:hypothetical protein